MMVEVTAYFGFACKGSSDDGRERTITTPISPTYAAQILQLREDGATEEELHPIVAGVITESYFTEWGTSFTEMGHQRRWPACGCYARPVNRFPVLARSNFGPAINHILRAATQRSGGGPLPNPHHEYEAEDDHALAAPAHRAPTARPSVRWLACVETA